MAKRLKTRTRAGGTAVRKAAKPAAPLRRAVRVICSECYEEFRLNAEFDGESLTCPDCRHTGNRPEEGFIAKVRQHQASEQMSLIMAVAAAVLFLGTAAALVLVNSFKARPTVDPNINYAIVFVALILLFVLGYAAVRYERNRWDVYF